MIKRYYFNICFLSHSSVVRVASLAFIFLLGVTITHADTVFTAVLNGNQAVPATNSTATGVGSVILNESETKVTVTLNLNNLQNTQTDARIHAPALRGETGGVIFSLQAGVSTQSFNVTTSQAAHLKAGLWYFNVTSSAFPDGEIRGQIDQLCAPPPENMKSWYQAENIIKDLTGNYNALPSGNVSYATGKVGQSFKFNGANQHVLLRDNFDYKTFTVSMWVKPAETQIASATLVDNSRTELANWSIEQNQNGTNYYSYIDKGGSVGFSLEPNVWQHLTIVRAENGIQIYRDGTLLNWMATSVPVNYSNGQNLWLARRVSNPNATDRNWNGQIDEFATFNRVLSETEIKSLYNSGSAGVCAESAWMPTAQNGKIVFFRDIGNFKTQIFSINNDGSNLTNLSNNPNVSDFHPAFSPDGSRIAFSRNWDIYMMNADGSNQINLIAPYTASESFPRWSPDGSKISFILGGSETAEVYTMNSFGTNLSRLTHNSVYDYGSKWSPDGTKIVFTSALFGGYGIHTMNADGSSGRALTSGNQDTSPAWSPDGKKIIFIRQADIYAMNTDGSGITNLTNTPTNGEYNPEWSPDSKKIVYTRDQGSTREIFVMNSDGSGQTSLLSTGQNNTPMWQRVSINQNVTVSPASNINVTFSQILTPGRTVATPLMTKQLPRLPEGYAPASPIYDIRTSVSYMNFVAVSFNITSVTNSSTCSNMRVMHFNDGAWIENNNVPPIFNSGICTVSQNVSTLSPFTVAHINSAPRTAAISGKITYGITPTGQTAKLVSDVLLTTSGASFAAFTTSADGTYLLDNLIENGQYTITPSRTGNVNGITPFDATLVLRCVAAGTNCSLTANQKLAADTNNSNSITPFDATLILRFVAANGQTSATGQVGNWKFSPAPRTYASIGNTLDNENYEAILIGEVNGNWAAPTAASLVENETTAPDASDVAAESVLSEEQFKQRETGMELSLPTNAAAPVGSTILIPVAFTNPGKPINAFSFGLTFNPNVLALDAANPVEQSGTLSSNFLISVHNTDSGRIGVAGAGGNNSIFSSATLINLRFKVIGTDGDAHTGATQLKFEQGREQAPAPDFRDQNDVSILPSISNGAFTVQNAPTSDSVKVKGKILTAYEMGIRRR